jgi:fibronectin type 3 domain-containing protein
MDLPLGNEGAMNGTAFVPVLAAPAASKQRVLPANGLTFHNPDTVVHTYTVQKKKGASTYQKWVSGAVASLDSIAMPLKVTLDATDESLEAKVDAGLTTTESTFDVSAGETS